MQYYSNEGLVYYLESNKAEGRTLHEKRNTFC